MFVCGSHDEANELSNEKKNIQANGKLEQRHAVSEKPILSQSGLELYRQALIYRRDDTSSAAHVQI